MRTEQEATILLLKDIIKERRQSRWIMLGVNLALCGVVCIGAYKKVLKGA